MVQGESGSWQSGGAAGAAAVTLLVLGGVLCCLLPSANAAHHSARISISFESDSYVAEFKDSGPAILDVKGTVSVKKDISSGGVATLDAVIDTGWRLLVSPTTMVATDMTQPFTVTVSVPQGTPHDLPGRLNVICRFANYGEGNASATIRAGPVFGLALDARNPIIVASEVRSFSLPARLTNTGNAVDSYWIDPSIFSCEIDRTRWFPSIGCCTVRDVGPGMSRTLNITAVPSTDSRAPRASLSSLKLRVESMNAQDHQRLVRGSLEVCIYIKPGWPDWADADVPMAAVILWAAAICAIAASAVRRGKRRKSLRVPILKEVGKVDGP